MSHLSDALEHARFRTDSTLSRIDAARMDPPDLDPRDGLCRRPGRKGCGECEGCEQWADEQYEAARETR